MAHPAKHAMTGGGRPWFVAVALPVIIVAAATLLPAARWPAVAVLLAGVLVLRPRRTQVVWLLGGLLPLAVRLAWAGSSGAAPLLGLADCGNLFSAPAVARAVEAVVVIGTLATAAVLLGADRRSLSLRWPARPIVALAIVGPLVVMPLALIAGPMLTGPFFGPVQIETGIAAAIVPALFLAVSNSALEELTFRGALLGWGIGAVGPTGALVLQAVLFGLVHTGPDFLNPLVQLPVLAAVAAGGLIAGLIVRRTGSLLLPFAIHVALDVPLYYAFACRLPG